MSDFGLENIDYCVQPITRPEEMQDAVKSALEENPGNMSYSPDIPLSYAAGTWHSGPPTLSNMEPSPLVMGLLVRFLWTPGKTIRVRFLEEGTPYIQSKIRHYAVQWSQYANIKFQFVDGPPSEVRITFKKGYGSSSKVGTLNKLEPKDEPTMNFSMFTDQTKEEDFSRIVLHEFGHVLGCVHEHQLPVANIKWNRPVVIREFTKNKNNNWIEADVEENIFIREAVASVESSEFDKHSIMIYPVPPEFTLDGFSSPKNAVLSPTDKTSIRRMYPFPSDITDIDTGAFNTLTVRAWNKPALENEIDVRFIKWFEEPPKVALGLQWLDFSNATNIRIRALVDSVEKDRMKVNLQSWADTINFSTGAAYFLMTADNDRFESGQFNTMEDHDWANPQPKTTHKIQFKKSFQSPPQVVVFLTALDIDNNSNIRVKTYATDITVGGFTIHVDTWSDTRLFSVGVTWIAFPVEEKGVNGGSFSTDDIRPWTEPLLMNSNRVEFGEKVLDHPPRIFMALSGLDIDRSRNARIRLSASNISPGGFIWHINSWSDSVLHYASGCYIAF